MKFIKILIIMLLIIAPASAQNYIDAARYFNQSISTTGFSLQSAGGLNLLHNDFSSVISNPAMSSLQANSSFEFQLDGFNSSIGSNYLNRTTEYDINQNAISNLSTTIKFPTIQGNFAVSVGYHQRDSFLDGFRASGFNTSNSVSDFLATSTDEDIRLIGYNGYATDSLGTGLQSSLRFGTFQGIDQLVQQDELGTMGDIILNTSIEFAEDVYGGISIGIPLGRYEYSRTYLENDNQDLYSNVPFDVNNILVNEFVEQYASGVYLKLGIVAKPVDFLRLGMSYQLPHQLFIQEEYSYSAITTNDDGSVPSSQFPYSFNGNFDYSLQMPSIFQVNAALIDILGINLGISYEARDFSKIEFSTSSEFKDFEFTNNLEISQELEMSHQIGVGLSLNWFEFQPTFGYSVMQNPFVSEDEFIQQFSAGITTNWAKNFQFQLGGQFMQRNQNSVNLYNSTDYGSNPNLSIDGFVYTMNIGLIYKF